ncbi:isoprenylcysteine carboxylmethyltransferase family protein [Chloroflexi bacterium TSY]|nr:isoprenylcysteine carboxylmethyltransferase family protein [Chloroflexi bacterium TSY]
MLKLNIPPPIVATIAAAGMYVTSTIDVPNAFTFSVPLWASLLMFVPGIIVTALAMKQFRTVQTTTNPVNPEAATALVTSGIFSYTRNPMYLGLAIFLFACVLLFGSWLGLLWLLAFIVYIQIFQISAEEKAMTKLFGTEYGEYCKSVRRWI